MATVRVLNGCRPSNIPLIGSPFVGAPAPSPDLFDPRVAWGVPGVRDQQFSNGCVGEGISAGITIATGSTVYISFLGVYTLARDRERRRRGAPVLDNGCMVADALAAIMGPQWGGYGVFAEADWPLTEADVNQEVPQDLLDDALPLQLSDVALVTSFGAQRCADTTLSCLARAPVGFAMPMWQSYNDLADDRTWEGPSAAERANGPKGRHFQLALGYRPAGQWGKAARLVRNSWGIGWAAGGYSWIADDYFASSDVSDCVAFRGGPNLAAA